MKKIILLISLQVSLAAQSQRAILIEEGKSIIHAEYSSALEMRAKRRVGIGATVAGKLGMLGVAAELNFSMMESAVVGFGGGPKYSVFLAEWKHVFESRTLAPYTAVGYSRWSGSGLSGSLTESTPSFFAQKFLSNDEKQSGKFIKDILTPTFGLQYNVLSGKNAGTAFYMELSALVSLANLETAVIGGAGILYYF